MRGAAVERWSSFCLAGFRSLESARIRAKVKTRKAKQGGDDEERRAEDEEGTGAAGEQLSRRLSLMFDDPPVVIKPIPRGSSFFVFSHTNRLEPNRRARLY